MPTIDRREGFRFEIYRNDHEPAHVHAKKGSGLVVVEIQATPVFVREVHEMKANEVRRAIRIVEENRERYLERWKAIHG